MAFHSALKGSKNINMTSVEQLAIVFYSFSVWYSWDWHVCREETRKLSFILVIFVVASNAKENRVTSSLKGINHFCLHRLFWKIYVVCFVLGQNLQTKGLCVQWSKCRKPDSCPQRAFNTSELTLAHLETIASWRGTWKYFSEKGIIKGAWKKCVSCILYIVQLL